MSTSIVWMGKTRVDSKLCARCNLSAMCMPLGRDKFASELLLKQILVSDPVDPTPCRAVDELHEKMKAFPMKEFKVPLAPTVDTDLMHHRWTTDWTYHSSITTAAQFSTPITLS